MSTFQVHIHLNPAEGCDDAFHEWYENTHLDDVLRTTGFRSAQRFGLGPVTGHPQPNRHLAIYEADADSAEELLELLNSTRDQRDMAGAENFDTSTMAIHVYEALGPRHELD